MAPKNARKPKGPAKVEPPKDVRDYFENEDKPLDDVDAEAHLKWLETGEGEPWPRGRRS